ncbi:MBL fold metallo-hydrolase [Streptantibioticus ferralitis]|uniref:MBL fold metallo-hydrolase n=1 Tax=Streptantibioticus ferralitis TaxID=236510 RepID=A0ABT5Z375_9ACTN|nr:MBL fold metallo-hydrolase [Streptantibioticus ferralitis]MDF2258281.1 MBL fold metallo-hydrolase [Streptantibioticus ferralitis]
MSGWRPLSFGADPTRERMARIQSSPNFEDGVFVNPTGPSGPPRGSAWGMLKSQLRKADRIPRRPAAPVPVYPYTLAELATPPSSGLRLTWMGHSSVLAEIDGRRVLFDPVWGERCSPFGFVGPRRVHPVPVPLTELGPLDAVVISHDHYDHLDLPTIRQLVGTGTQFVVPLGVGSHLERWGVPTRQMTELDWQESSTIAGLTFTATPARHFCGRGIRNTQHTLWASWAVRGPEHRIYHSGDTGYFPGFADIGAKHGPFDATMIQIGAYSDYWPDIHMTPGEGIRTHLDLQRDDPAQGVLLPIHWGTFNLAFHPWAEPIEQTMYAAHRAGVAAAAPKPGQPFEPSGQPPAESWWRAVAVPPAAGWPAWPPAAAAQAELDLAADR